jgi:hypothetical protein
VVLEKEGSIAEQGAFERLNASGGYVSSFDLASPDWEFTPEKQEYEAPPRYSEPPNASQSTEEELQAEANRRTGDVAIYGYYVGTVGWIPTIIFVVSITIFIFGMSFPSKSSLHSSSSTVLTRYYSHMGKNVGGVQPRSSKPAPWVLSRYLFYAWWSRLCVSRDQLLVSHSNRLRHM